MLRRAVNHQISDYDPGEVERRGLRLRRTPAAHCRRGGGHAGPCPVGVVDNDRSSLAQRTTDRAGRHDTRSPESSRQPVGPTEVHTCNPYRKRPCDHARDVSRWHHSGDRLPGGS